jgi:DUF917 family protein
VKELVLTTREEIEDLVTGCAFMGTGGGGSPEDGLALLLATLNKGLSVRLTPPSDIPDEAWICTGSNVGSIAPRTAEEQQILSRLGMERRIEKEIVRAVDELMEYKNCRIVAIAPTEIGGLNTAAPLDAAANLGITAIDGDFAGRALPETNQFLFCIAGMDIWPRVFCDYAGNVTIIKSAINPLVMERIQKHIAMSAMGLVGAAGHLMRGNEMKQMILPGTISRALSIGKEIRVARKKGNAFADEVARVANAWTLFQGRVIRKDWVSKDGYMIGDLELEGMESFKGHVFRIWFKNEYHVSWFDGKEFVTSPDLICVVDLDSKNVLTNTNISKGNQLAVFGMKSHESFRSGKGLEVLCPSYFGFDIPYVPIEERLSNGFIS